MGPFSYSRSKLYGVFIHYIHFSCKKTISWKYMQRGYRVVGNVGKREHGILDQAILRFLLDHSYEFNL